MLHSHQLLHLRCGCCIDVEPYFGPPFGPQGFPHVYTASIRVLFWSSYDASQICRQVAGSTCNFFWQDSLLTSADSAVLLQIQPVLPVYDNELKHLQMLLPLQVLMLL